jgi:hypothetical protein
MPLARHVQAERESTSLYISQTKFFSRARAANKFWQAQAHASVFTFESEHAHYTIPLWYVGELHRSRNQAEVSANKNSNPSKKQFETCTIGRLRVLLACGIIDDVYKRVPVLDEGSFRMALRPLW